jgi:RNA polymerase sigma factor (sigma-70 family)
VAARHGTEDTPDTELLRRFVTASDATAFELLLWRHERLVMGVCRRVLKDVHDAEDAFQATFLVLARKARSIGTRGPLTTWLYTVAYRTSLNALKRRARQRARVGSLPAAADVPAAEAPADLSELLDEAVSRLPEKYRAAVVLCFLEGRSHEEAARMLGCAPGTVASRLGRAKEKLRAWLAMRGLALTARALAAGVGAASAELASARAVVSDVLRAAKAVVMGGDVAAAVAPRVLILAEGVKRTMLRSKLTLALIVTLAAAGVGGVGLGLAGRVPTALGDGDSVATQDQGGAGSPLSPADAQADGLPSGARLRLGTVRLRQGGPINSVAYSPDGKVLASGCGGIHSSVCLWDAATGQLLREFSEGLIRNEIKSVAFSPDGKTLAIGGRLGKVVCLETATGKVVSSCLGHGGSVVECVTFSPDGTVLATAGGKSVELWKAGAKEPFLQLQTSLPQVTSVALAADGRTLACGGGTPFRKGGEAQLWEVTTGKQLRRLAHGGAVYAVSFSPDGARLASAATYPDKAVRLWEVATGKELHILPGHEPSRFCGSVKFLPDGKTLVSGGEDQVIRLWDADSGKELGQLRGRCGSVPSLAISPDGKRLAAASLEGQCICIWDLAKREELLGFGGYRAPQRALAFSPDGKLVATGGADGALRLWDAVTGREPRRLGEATDAIVAAAFSPNGRVLASADETGTIRMWEVASSALLRELKGHKEQGVSTLAFTPDGKWLYSASGSRGDGTVRLWDVVSGAQVRQLRLQQGGVGSLALSPDGRTLATAGFDDGTVLLWDAATGAKLRSLANPPLPGNHVIPLSCCLAFSPDSQLLAAAGEDYRDASVRLWDVATGRLRTIALPVGHWHFALTFSPNSKMLASGGYTLRPGRDDCGISLWEVATGQERCRLVGHRGLVGALAFSPDGSTLASASEDTTALLWDLLLARGAAPRGPALSRQQLIGLWRDLSKEDAAEAFHAMRTLAAAPGQAVPCLAERLPPVRPDAERVARLIAELDSDRFETRQKAAQELTKMGAAAEPGMRKARAREHSAEVLRQLEQLLERFAPSSPETLREQRAVEVLEAIGSANAWQALQTMAKGADEAHLTREAQAALQRLNK